MKKNIILISVDALRADYCGFINNELGNSSPTKNIDQLAKDGIVFSNCFAAGVPTFLSFPSLFTSKYPSLSMDNGIRLPNHPTFVEKLKEEGYKTYGIVDNNPYSSSLMGFSRGFDFFEDYTVKKTNFNNEKSFKAIIPNKIKEKMKPFISALEPEKFQPKNNTKKIINKAFKILKEKNKPIFIWMHLMDVHWPYRLPSKTMPIKFRYECCKSRRKYSAVPNAYKIKEADIENMKHMYIESIKYLDNLLSGFIKKSITENNSAIFLISDHGEELGERGNFDHQENVYVEVAQIPFTIIGVPEKKRINEMCSSLDIGKMIENYAENDVIELLTRELVITETVYPSVNKQAKAFKEILRSRPKKYIYSIRSKKQSLVIDHKEILCFSREADPYEIKGEICTKNSDANILSKYVEQHINRGKIISKLK